MPTTPTYWDYLKLDQLLNLQGGLETDESDLLPDELHFIIVHQVYELWFKLCLRSLRLARDQLAQPRVAEEVIPQVVHHLRRASSILQLGVEQFRVVETLTPQGFLAFRDKLVPASGFQSFQMREIEIVMGLAESERHRYGGVDPIEHVKKQAQSSPGGANAWGRIQAALAEGSVLNALNDWLYRTPIQGSTPNDPNDASVVKGFLSEYLRASDIALEGALKRLLTTLETTKSEKMEERFEALRLSSRSFLYAEDIQEEHRDRILRCRAAILFIESYRRLPLLAWPRLLLDVIVETEEQLVLWRARHARMVERLIGRRPGTGGSGVEYLDKTTDYRIFRDLWSVRTILLAEQRLPALIRPDLYGFAND